MQQEIINKLHTALYRISPLVTDRERLIADMGEVIWLESLEKILLALPDDERSSVVNSLNNNDLDSAIEALEKNNVDVDAIITEVATKVMDEVVAKSWVAIIV